LTKLLRVCPMVPLKLPLPPRLLLFRKIGHISTLMPSLCQSNHRHTNRRLCLLHPIPTDFPLNLPRERPPNGRIISHSNVSNQPHSETLPQPKPIILWSTRRPTKSIPLLRSTTLECLHKLPTSLLKISTSHKLKDLAPSLNNNPSPPTLRNRRLHNFITA